jgi:hypothetical protein
MPRRASLSLSLERETVGSLGGWEIVGRIRWHNISFLNGVGRVSLPRIGIARADDASESHQEQTRA